MKADLSKPMLQAEPGRRRVWVQLTFAGLTILAAVAFMWRIGAAMQASQVRMAAFVKDAVPASRSFVEGLAAQDWKKVRNACANRLRSQFNDGEATKLLAAHPELAGTPQLQGFEFAGHQGLSFAEFFGMDHQMPNARYRFRYLLTKQDQPQGATLTFDVIWEVGEARVVDVRLNNQPICKQEGGLASP